MGVAEKRKSVAEPAKPKLLGGTAIKPPERHGWEKISYLLYNKDTGEILTRTPKSWALITIFYLIYYSLLAGFWYGMLQLFMMSVPKDEPKYTLGASIIGDNPGVGMQPPQADAKLDSSMLFLKYDSPASEQPTDDAGEGLKNADWARRYELYLEKNYKNKTKNVDATNCPPSDPTSQACKFDYKTVLGDCATKPYGYLGTVEPCVLLKINRIYGWVPQEYSAEDLANAQVEDQDYPEDKMPKAIADKLTANPKKVYIDCQGENNFDIEGLGGKMKYFPADQGISHDYFPYKQTNNADYHSPMVAVKFQGLARGVLYHVQCKLWAKGVRHSKKDRAGLVHFEIFLDDKIRE